MKPSISQTIICMKWGDRYGPEFVNRLWRAVRRNTRRDTRLVCFTDDNRGVDSDITCLPLPEINLPDNLINTPWRKLAVWQAPLADLSGDILFLDLDLVITGNLDDLFDFAPGRYCVIENWTQKGQGNGNTSCFRFPVGKHTHIYEQANANPALITSQYRVEQLYISREIEDMVFWPAQWCASFKHSLLPKWPLNFLKAPPLPADTRIVAFTGKPDQDEAARGEWPVKHWYKRAYKYVRPTPWIYEHWQ